MSFYLLWNASNSNDINGLIEIIERLSKDVKIYPELEIFNFAISAIDLLTKVPQDINSSQQRCPWYNFSCNGKLTNDDKNNCRKAAETSGVIGGVFGMVRGAVVGGITGSVLGLNPGTGGAGAVIGATVGGVAGFVEGVAFGYIGCKIFGS